MTNKDIIRQYLDRCELKNVEVEHYLAKQGCWCCEYDYRTCKSMNPPYDDSACMEGKCLWMYKEIPNQSSDDSPSLKILSDFIQKLD